MRYVYGIDRRLPDRRRRRTRLCSPVGAQTAQNEPGAIAAAAPRAGAPMSFADLAERLQPAVVNISTRQRIQVSQRRQLPPGFERFFRRFGGEAPTRARQGGDGPSPSAAARWAPASSSRRTAISSPTTMSSRRRAHGAVVEQITVTLPDRTRISRRRLVGRDVASDLARAEDRAPTGRCPSSASAIRPASASATGWSRSAIRSASAAPSRRHRLGASPQPARRRPLRPLHPDRRLDQFGQFAAARCSI